MKPRGSALTAWTDTLATPELGEALEFLRLLWAVAHGLESLSKRMARTLGVTGPQRLVLRLVGRFPSVTSSQLAVLLHVHASTLTGVLQRLERRGLLARRRDGQDRRRSLIGLTAEGRRLDVATPGTIEAAVTAALAKMDPGDATTARAALNLLISTLDETLKGYGEGQGEGDDGGPRGPNQKKSPAPRKSVRAR
jgi:DNA-binding MarR family transcriptional regulator